MFSKSWCFIEVLETVYIYDLPYLLFALLSLTLDLNYSNNV